MYLVDSKIRLSTFIKKQDLYLQEKYKIYTDCLLLDSDYVINFSI